jgi:hypothetical protein
MSFSMHVTSHFMNAFVQRMSPQKHISRLLLGAILTCDCSVSLFVTMTLYFTALSHKRIYNQQNNNKHNNNNMIVKDIKVPKEVLNSMLQMCKTGDCFVLPSGNREVKKCLKVSGCIQVNYQRTYTRTREAIPLNTGGNDPTKAKEYLLIYFNKNGIDSSASHTPILIPNNMESKGRVVVTREYYGKEGNIGMYMAVFYVSGMKDKERCRFQFGVTNNITAEFSFSSNLMQDGEKVALQPETMDKCTICVPHERGNWETYKGTPPNQHQDFTSTFVFEDVPLVDYLFENDNGPQQHELYQQWNC